jgi:hypothetical protein
MFDSCQYSSYPPSFSPSLLSPVTYRMARNQQDLAVANLRARTGYYTGDLVVNTGQLMIRNPIRTLLFLAGIAVFALAKGLSPPADRIRAYESRLPTTAEADAIARLEARTSNARIDYTQSRGWFWTCNHECEMKRLRYEKLHAELESSAAHWRSAVSDAKAELGPFSEQAVAETRSYFWSRINEGWRLATDVRERTCSHSHGPLVLFTCQLPPNQCR